MEDIRACEQLIVLVARRDFYSLLQHNENRLGQRYFLTRNKLLLVKQSNQILLVVFAHGIFRDIL